MTYSVLDLFSGPRQVSCASRALVANKRCGPVAHDTSDKEPRTYDAGLLRACATRRSWQIPACGPRLEREIRRSSRILWAGLDDDALTIRRHLGLCEFWGPCAYAFATFLCGMCRCVYGMPPWTDERPQSSTLRNNIACSPVLAQPDQMASRTRDKFSSPFSFVDARAGIFSSSISRNKIAGPASFLRGALRIQDILSFARASTRYVV